jgi:LPXTG-motif cell wall-anchored protein
MTGEKMKALLLLIGLLVLAVGLFFVGQGSGLIQ